MPGTDSIAVPHFFMDDDRQILYLEQTESPLFALWAEKYQVAGQVISKPVHQFRVDFSREEPLDPPLSEMGTQCYWSISREHPSYQQARREFFDIAYLYTYANRGMRTHYRDRKNHLVQEGYPEAEIERVREPLEEIPALHLKGGCTGELHVGKVRHRQRETRSFCTVCGWFFSVFGTEPVRRNQLEDVGPFLLPQNPDCVVYPLDGPEMGSLSQKEQDDIGLAYMRRCLKHFGKLISISEAAHMLGCTTQNVSNYVAKGRLSAWPDPDDNRYRLLWRKEIEEFIQKEGA